MSTYNHYEFCNNVLADGDNVATSMRKLEDYLSTVTWSERAGAHDHARSAIMQRHNVELPTFRATQHDGTEAERAEWRAGATHWRCTFSRRDGAKVRRMSIPYHMGSAHRTPPKMWEVLSCLFSDAESAGESFASWAADMGLDTDSRKAERSYKACQSIRKRLEALFGADYETFHELSRDV